MRAREAWHIFDDTTIMTHRKRYRIGVSVHPWDLATATCLAEHKRSKQHERDPDWNAALSGFELNPWRWDIVEGRASQVRVYFLWTWRVAGNENCSFELVCKRLDNLLARGDVPSPGL